MLQIGNVRVVRQASVHGGHTYCALVSVHLPISQFISTHYFAIDPSKCPQLEFYT
jgi:hypothetical protein